MSIATVIQSITAKVSRLTTARNNIRVALAAKGVTASTHGFEDFAEDIGDIQTGSTPSGTLPISANGTYDVAQYANASVNVPQTHLHFEFTLSSNLPAQWQTLMTDARLAEIRSLSNAAAVLNYTDSQQASSIIYSSTSNAHLSNDYYGIYLRTNSSGASSPVGISYPLNTKPSGSSIGQLFIDTDGKLQIYGNSSYVVRAGNYTVDVYW